MIQRQAPLLGSLHATAATAQRPNPCCHPRDCITINHMVELVDQSKATLLLRWRSAGVQGVHNADEGRMRAKGKLGPLTHFGLG